MNGTREVASCAPASAARLSPAEHELIERHMGLAARIAAKYRGRRLDADELEAVAYAALVDAASRYDVVLYPEESFVRFADRVIRSALWDAMCAAPVVRMGQKRERAVLRGQAAGCQPYAIAVEDLGLATRADDGTAELLGLALADCTELQRGLIELIFVQQRSVGQAAGELGLTRREARAAYEGALRTLAVSLRSRGYDPPSVPRLAERN
jgi:RNA polymerase sigma factor (sigma-70 family)